MKLETECCTLDATNIGYIYITTNNINGKQYIGKRTKPYFDTKYYGSGKHLKRAIQKYGIENFSVEIIEWCKSIDELNKAEKKWIKYYNAQEDPMFYNISSGGDWGDISKGMSPDELKEWGQKISQANTGKKRTYDQKKHISDALKGKPRNLSEEAINKRKGSGNHRYGKKWSEEDRKMLREHSTTKRKVKAIFNKDVLTFNSVQECYEYFHDQYLISKFLIKKILKEGKPYVLNGNCKTQDNVKKIEGLELMYEE